VTLSGTRIWSFELRHHDPAEVVDAAAELESLGFSAVWIPDIGGDVYTPLERLLGATATMTIATGILNIWKHDADEVAARRASWSADWQDRFLLGIGVSHAPLIGDDFAKPMDVTRAYLDALDAAGVPQSSRALAALGPKMLALARDRTAGAHPYLVTPEHTAMARETLGDGALLLVEQGVVLGTDPDIARMVARQTLANYLALPNYCNNWRRLGFTEDDLANGGSDRLVDEVIAWGDVDTVAERIAAHKEAGADHVCVQVHVAPNSPMPRALWRDLAPAVV
jgi:probable F420-dependent oxidoreductase